MTSKLADLALPEGEKVVLNREMLRMPKIPTETSTVQMLKKAIAASKRHQQALRSENKPFNLYVKVAEASSISQREKFWVRLLSDDLRINLTRLEPQIVQEYVYTRED